MAEVTELYNVAGKKLNFRRIKFELTNKATRGGKDNFEILDGIKEDWESLQTELSTLPESEKQELKDHFNSIINGFDRIGDVLFGVKDDFSELIADMEGPVVD